MTSKPSKIDGVLAGRTLPMIDHDNRPFFEAARRGELVIQRCRETGLFQHYPRSCSIQTFGEIEWVRVSGKGKVHSFTVVRQNAVDPVFAQLVPYVIGLIELPEGVRMMGNITGCNHEDIYVEMPVEVYFSAVDEAGAIHLPFWRPAA